MALNTAKKHGFRIRTSEGQTNHEYLTIDILILSLVTLLYSDCFIAGAILWPCVVMLSAFILNFYWLVVGILCGSCLFYRRFHVNSVLVIRWLQLHIGICFGYVRFPVTFMFNIAKYENYVDTGRCCK